MATNSNVQISGPEDVGYGWLDFSPDGNFLYMCKVLQGGLRDLFRVPVLGGTPQRIVRNIGSNGCNSLSLPDRKTPVNSGGLLVRQQIANRWQVTSHHVIKHDQKLITKSLANRNRRFFLFINVFERFVTLSSYEV